MHYFDTQFYNIYIKIESRQQNPLVDKLYDLTFNSYISKKSYLVDNMKNLYILRSENNCFSISQKPL